MMIYWSISNSEISRRVELQWHTPKLKADYLQKAYPNCTLINSILVTS
jgi:hypothetical protein